MRKTFIRMDFKSILFLISLLLTISLLIYMISVNLNGQAESTIKKVVGFIALFIVASLSFTSLATLIDDRKRERING